jgi:hypothetical protein
LDRRRTDEVTRLQRHVYTYSGKASDISRQLALAGIAVIWLFKKEVANQVSIPEQLILPGILIVAALACDLLQYCAGSIIWWLFYRAKETEGVREDTNIKHSVYLEGPIWAFFLAKVVLLMWAYVGIAIFLVGLLKLI